MQRLTHRREIDGLRAVAVMAVILYHAEVRGFAGGFVGVDVFFVISGFLITSILLADLDAGTFSFVRFFERRARRLLPALLAMLGVVTAASVVLLPRTRFSEVANDAFHATIFTANINFFQQAGYFEANSATSPLLHTWSLSVEEQFYVALPVLLFVLRRASHRRLFALLAGLSVASFALTQWSSTAAPEFGFFLPFTRAWELFAGSLAAIVTRRAGTRSSDIASIAGVVLVMAPVVMLDEAVPFPSHLALAPVGGTVLLLVFGTDRTRVGRILATRPMVAVGLVSYSAYLWHQPLFALARVRSAPQPLSPVLTIALIGITLIIAYVSWRWIEQPVRRGRAATLPPRRVLVAAVCALGAIGGSAKVVATTIDRSPAGEDTDASDIETVRGQTAADELEVPLVRGAITIKRPTSPMSGCAVLAFGDSHTGHLSSGFAKRFIDATECAVHIWTFSGCPSLLGHSKIYDLDERSLPKREEECAEQVRTWGSYVERNGSRYDAVIMSSRWNWLIGPSEYGDGQPIRRDAVVELPIDQAAIGALDDEARFENLTTALRATVDRLRVHIPWVILLSQPPVQLFDVRDLEVGPAFVDAAPERDDAAERHDLWTEAVAQSGVESVEGVVYVDLFGELFCTDPTGRCRNLIDDEPLYADTNHLSPFGSEQVAEVVLRRLEELAITIGP